MKFMGGENGRIPKRILPSVRPSRNPHGVTEKGTRNRVTRCSRHEGQILCMSNMQILEKDHVLPRLI